MKSKIYRTSNKKNEKKIHLHQNVEEEANTDAIKATKIRKEAYCTLGRGRYYQNITTKENFPNEMNHLKH